MSFQTIAIVETVTQRVAELMAPERIEGTRLARLREAAEMFADVSGFCDVFAREFPARWNDHRRDSPARHISTHR